MYLTETNAVEFPALFYFNIGMVHEFDTVNNLDTWRTGKCEPQPCVYIHKPHSQYTVLKIVKSWVRPGNEASCSLEVGLHSLEQHLFDR